MGCWKIANSDWMAHIQIGFCSLVVFFFRKKMKGESHLECMRNCMSFENVQFSYSLRSRCLKQQSGTRTWLEAVHWAIRQKWVMSCCLLKKPNLGSPKEIGTFPSSTARTTTENYTFHKEQFFALAAAARLCPPASSSFPLSHAASLLDASLDIHFARSLTDSRGHCSQTRALSFSLQIVVVLRDWRRVSERGKERRRGRECASITEKEEWATAVAWNRKLIPKRLRGFP